MGISVGVQSFKCRCQRLLLDKLEECFYLELKILVCMAVD